jgi:chromosome partitioning protein
MADIICVIGNKGGTGKTTISHMLCQGMGLLGQRSVCVLTDTCREPLDPAGRRYLVADARSREALTKVTSKIRSLKSWMGVIDGGGNRTEMDRNLYGVADLVLLPFRDSHEDIRTVIRDLEMFPRAYAIPSQWPTNVWQREAAEKTIDEFLSRFGDRILSPVATLSASKQLLQKTIPGSLPSALANASRGIARQVLDLLQISFADEEDASRGRHGHPTGRTARPRRRQWRPEPANASVASPPPGDHQGGFGSVADPHGLDDGRGVDLYRALGQAEQLPDLAVAAAFGQKFQHTRLGLGQTETLHQRLAVALRNIAAIDQFLQFWPAGRCRPTAPRAGHPADSVLEPDLETKPEAPAFITRDTVSASSSADRMTTGTVGKRRRTNGRKCLPLGPRQHQVEDHHVDVLGLQHADRRIGIRHTERPGFRAEASQHRQQPLAHQRMVFDHQ